MFDLLLGDNLSGRREYIAENGAQYLEPGGYFGNKRGAGGSDGTFSADGWAEAAAAMAVVMLHTTGGGRMAGGLLQSACAVFRAAFSDAFRPRICKSVRVRWASVYGKGTLGLETAEAGSAPRTPSGRRLICCLKRLPAFPISPTV